MKKHVELPLVESVYSTYHYQGASTAIIKKNPSIRNWYLNEIMNLTCNRKFLHGFTTPELTISNSSWDANPYFDKRMFYTEFTKGYINPIIKELLNKGYYVVFDGVDDYYIRGKTWYKKRHFSHDGLICGYNENDKTYCIYAYNENWIYQKFWIPQKDFNAGRVAMRKKGIFSSVCGVKIKENIIEFSPDTAIQKIREYLDSNLEKYHFSGEGNVYGIVVHEYIAKYVTKLYTGDIPYERMDRRVFRLIWEHKKVMLERIVNIEQFLNLTDEISKKYECVVSDAGAARMLYASHNVKRRDSVLPIIKKKLLNLAEKEKELLTMLVDATKKEIENEVVELY